jgi:hypothetical protein
MTVQEFFRQQASGLKHAIVRDVTYDSDGRMLEKREFHYLSCKKCELEKKADELELKEK